MATLPFKGLAQPLILIALLSTACGQPSYVGTWHFNCDGNKQTQTLRENGTFTWPGPGQSTIAGTYRVDGGYIYYKFDLVGTTYVWKMSLLVEGDKITIAYVSSDPPINPEPLNRPCSGARG